VHIADYHHVNRDDFATDLRDQDTNVTEAEIETEYQALIATVREVQANQLRLIRWLAKEQGVRVVYLEGPTENNADVYATMVQWCAKAGSTTA
jgi:hypothetical protein